MDTPFVFAIKHSAAIHKTVSKTFSKIIKKPVTAAYNAALTDIPPVIADILKDEIVKQLDNEGYEATVTINFTIKHK